jgi:hypothetical protein
MAKKIHEEMLNISDRKGNTYQNHIKRDSKMATRGRKQKACFLKQHLGEMLEIHLTGKTTKKRQNSNCSTLPAHA